MVYPRGCGGTYLKSMLTRQYAGLSPRVRGNPARAFGAMRLIGSIPAGAGEPTSSHALSEVVMVYPRGCGGTYLKSMLTRQYAGLSPRVRGNPARAFGAMRLIGSIPAGAGEPTSSHALSEVVMVYPRGCGGTYLKSMLTRQYAGLSPRVRGNLLKVDVDQAVWGSIPAGAGEPSSSLWSNAPDRVYPRGCGGTFLIFFSMLLNGGLSPRVRGNHSGLPEAMMRRRSIPAGAGEPASTSPRPRYSRVYPRGCGGTTA